ncbi:gamma-tubulin complex component 2 [Anaeramoeba flamelloides]|uniref:Gamma-tubulin complex component 2 n=1 Tax=Anaeramoeba flamelloides TaxID=1746091 RepID=A0ABQ8Y7M9_9EUKA|nr:gamma-tubulin complex component 2 [Anaeramoeba flamelloides]
MEELIGKLFLWLEIDESPRVYSSTLIKKNKKIELSRVGGKTILQKLNNAGSYPRLIEKFKKKYNLTMHSTSTEYLEQQKELPELMGVFALIITYPSLLKILENKILLDELTKGSKSHHQKKNSFRHKPKQSFRNNNKLLKKKKRNKNKDQYTNKNKNTNKNINKNTNTNKNNNKNKNTQKDVPDLLTTKFENDYFLSPDSKEKLDSIQIREASFTPISIPISTKKQHKKKKSQDKLALKDFEQKNIQFSDWSNTRPYLNGTHLVQFTRESVLIEDNKKQIGDFPVEIQEKLILQDLLYCLIGIEGKYITVITEEEKNQVSFEYDQTLDESLGDLTRQILPLCNSHYSISRYTFRYFNYIYGKINHSFCSAINELLEDYYLTISKFDEKLNTKGDFTLQKLKRYLTPSSLTFTLINNLIKELIELKAKGGILINLIQEHIEKYGSDLHSRSLFFFLLEKACKPYLQMVEKWLFTGIVEDPYEEFIIIKNNKMVKTGLTNDYHDRYWEKKYTLRRYNEQIDLVKLEDYDYDEFSNEERLKKLGYAPFFLKKYSEKLLTAGKYLNVIKECGIKIDCRFSEPFSYSFNEQEYQLMINKVYNWSSEKLLTLLVEKNQLFEHLEALKRYFLIGTGDWMSHFIDLAMKELSKKIVEVVPNKLVSILGVALQNSISKNDPLKEKLTCVLLPNNLINQLMQIIDVMKIRNQQKYSKKKQKKMENENESRREEKNKNQQISSKFTGNNMFTTSLFKDKLEVSNFDIDGKAQFLLTPRVIQQQPNVMGIDVFALDYQVSWPLSLFINKKILTKYQIIFRHLFYCKRVEKQICDAWKAQQRTKEIDFELVLLQSYSLIQKMLHFIQNLQYYMHFEVLEQNWLTFKTKIRKKKVKSIDKLMKYHEDFLDTCLKQCMLTNPRLLRSLTKILSTCQIFSTHTKRLTESFTITNREKLNIENRNPNISDSNTFSALKKSKQSQSRMELIKKYQDKIKIEAENVKKLLNEKGFSNMIKNSEKKFIQNLALLLISLQSYSQTDFDPQMADLVTRLDYNRFYSNVLNSKDFRIFNK